MKRLQKGLLLFLSVLLIGCSSGTTTESAEVKETETPAVVETVEAEVEEEVVKVELSEEDLEYYLNSYPGYLLEKYDVNSEEELLELFTDETKEIYLKLKESQLSSFLSAPLYNLNDRSESIIDSDYCKTLLDYEEVSEEARTLLKSLIECGLNKDKFGILDGMREDGVLDTFKAVAISENLVDKENSIFVTRDDENALIYLKISPYNSGGLNYYYELTYRQQNGVGFSFKGNIGGQDEQVNEVVAKFVYASTENYLLQGEFVEESYFLYGEQDPQICSYQGSLKDEYYDGEIIRYDENGNPQRYAFFDRGTEVPHYEDNESQWAQYHEGELATRYSISESGSAWNNYLYLEEGEEPESGYGPILNGF